MSTPPFDNAVIDAVARNAAAGDLEDAKMIASTIANRAALTGSSWRAVVADTKQYGTGVRRGVDLRRQRELAKAALTEVASSGPIPDVTHFSRGVAPAAGLQEAAKTDAHTGYTDPQARPLKTAAGYIGSTLGAVGDAVVDRARSAAEALGLRDAPMRGVPSTRQNLDQAKQDFFAEHYRYAREAGLTGVQAKLAVTQAAIETGWGKVGVAVKGNNFHGMKKGTGWSGKTISLPTREETKKGKSYTTTADFRQYDTPVDSYRDWKKQIETKWPGVMKATTFADAVEALNHGVKGVYSTSKTYADKLTKTAAQLEQSGIPEALDSPAARSVDVHAQHTTPHGAVFAGGVPNADVLDTLHPALQDRAKAFFAEANRRGIAIAPVPGSGGYRTKAKQAAINATGVISASPGRSYHNLGLGFDYVAVDPETGKPKTWTNPKTGKVEFDPTVPEWAQARQLAEEMGMVQPIAGDLGHVQLSNFPTAVPDALRNAPTFTAPNGLSYPELDTETAMRVAGPFNPYAQFAETAKDSGLTTLAGGPDVKDLVPAGQGVLTAALEPISSSNEVAPQVGTASGQEPAPSNAETVEPSAYAAAPQQSSSERVASALADLLSPVSSAEAAARPGAESLAPLSPESLGPSSPEAVAALSPSETVTGVDVTPEMLGFTPTGSAVAPDFAPASANRALQLASLDPSAGLAAIAKASTPPTNAVRPEFVGSMPAARAVEVASLPGFSRDVVKNFYDEETAKMGPPAQALSPVNSAATVAPLGPEAVAPLGAETVPPAVSETAQQVASAQRLAPVQSELAQLLGATEALTGTTPATVAPLQDPNTTVARIAAPPLPPPKQVRTIPVAQPRITTPAMESAAVAPTPAERSLTAADIYGGTIGQALDNTGQNTVSRDELGRIGVTNQWGVTTVTAPDGRTTTSRNGPLTAKSVSQGDFMGDLGANLPSAREVIGALIGGALGSTVAGPIGGAAGAALGRHVATMENGPLGALFDHFPDAPEGPKGNKSNRSDKQMRDISPRATDHLNRGLAGLF